jgi:hypothetical protein
MALPMAAERLMMFHTSDRVTDALRERKRILALGDKLKTAAMDN